MPSATTVVQLIQLLTFRLSKLVLVRVSISQFILTETAVVQCATKLGSHLT